MRSFRILIRPGLCGYEIKNSEGFTGFASGGVKGLWLSHEESFDNCLVFYESAIDALGHAVLFPYNRPADFRTASAFAAPPTTGSRSGLYLHRPLNGSRCCPASTLQLPGDSSGLARGCHCRFPPT